MSIEMMDNNSGNAGHGPICIKVIGVGGGGGNAVNYQDRKSVV